MVVVGLFTDSWSSRTNSISMDTTSGRKRDDQSWKVGESCFKKMGTFTQMVTLEKAVEINSEELWLSKRVMEWEDVSRQRFQICCVLLFWNQLGNTRSHGMMVFKGHSNPHQYYKHKTLDCEYESNLLPVQQEISETHKQWLSNQVIKKQSKETKKWQLWI